MQEPYKWGVSLFSWVRLHNVHNGAQGGWEYLNTQPYRRQDYKTLYLIFGKNDFFPIKLSQVIFATDKTFLVNLQR